MIFIITAMYAEAHPFITRFQLKKDISHTRFQVFLNEDAGICLVISGTGSVPAAVAVGSICTKYGVRPEDFLLNVGVCAQIWMSNLHSSEKICKSENSPGSKNLSASKALCQMGQVFLCNKISEQSTGRTFYPDILYRHEFAEAEIVTGSKSYEFYEKKVSAAIDSNDNQYTNLYEKTLLTAAYSCDDPNSQHIKVQEKPHPNEIDASDFCLYDMEAAAVYQAGAYFFGPHQMSFLKIVSDHGDSRNVSSGQIERLIDTHIERIADYIACLQTAAQNDRQTDMLALPETTPPIYPEETLPQKDLKAISPVNTLDSVQRDWEKLCVDLHCSRVMSESLRQYLRYCILSGVDYDSVLTDMYREGKLPCKDKREGKKYFEELKERLL